MSSSVRLTLPGECPGWRIVSCTCHWKRSSPTGPALQFEGGSFWRSANSWQDKEAPDQTPADDGAHFSWSSTGNQEGITGRAAEKPKDMREASEGGRENPPRRMSREFPTLLILLSAMCNFCSLPAIESHCVSCGNWGRRNPPPSTAATRLPQGEGIHGKSVCFHSLATVPPGRRWQWARPRG